MACVWVSAFSVSTVLAIIWWPMCHFPCAHFSIAPSPCECSLDRVAWCRWCIRHLSKSRDLCDHGILRPSSWFPLRFPATSYSIASFLSLRATIDLHGCCSGSHRSVYFQGPPTFPTMCCVRQTFRRSHCNAEKQSKFSCNQSIRMQMLSTHRLAS